MASAITRTHLAFHTDSSLHKLKTTISSITPFTSLPETSQSLFKLVVAPNSSVVVTPSTVFHPQGGGQPSDVGTISSASARFEVSTARTDAHGQVLHLGSFVPADADATFQPGDVVTQEIDADKRLLYSRLHTAGHVLGSAVRHLLEDQVDGFDEIKASHFPDSAACEFTGLIKGKWKGPIQERVDEYIAKAMPVEIEFWDEDDFKAKGLERLTPDREAMGMEAGEKFRVVNIVGAEVYPCGGTHVLDTSGCGKTTVRKIGRNKGTSRVAYTVEGA